MCQMIVCKKYANNCREGLFASLNIVCSILKGSEHVLPTWKEEPLELVECLVKYNISIMPLTEVRKCATMPDGSNVRHYLVGIMSQVQRAMLENAEDNTKSFFALIQVRKVFFTNTTDSPSSSLFIASDFQELFFLLKLF